MKLYYSDRLRWNFEFQHYCNQSIGDDNQTRAKGNVSYYVSEGARLSLLNFSSTLEHAITNGQIIKIDLHWNHQFLSMLVLTELAKTKWHVILMKSNKDAAPETKVSTYPRFVSRMQGRVTWTSVKKIRVIRPHTWKRKKKIKITFTQKLQELNTGQTCYRPRLS